MHGTALSRLQLHRYLYVVAVVVSLLVVSIFPPCLHGEEIVLHRFESPEPDSGLEDVLYLSAGVRLMQAGFSSTRDEAGARYVLLASYRWRAGGRVLVRYTLTVPAEPGRSLTELELEFPLDHDLDERISAAVDRLFRDAEISPVASPDARIIGLLSGPPASRSVPEPADTRQPAADEPLRVSDTAPASLSGLDPDGSGSSAPPALDPADTLVLSGPAAPLTELGPPEPGIPGPAVPGREVPVPELRESEPFVHEPSSPETAESDMSRHGPPEPEPEEPEPHPETGAGDLEDAARPPVAVRFDSSVSAAGVVLFGDITEFFHYGAGGRFSAGAEWVRESWSLSLGAAVSVVRVFNDRGVTGGPLYLSTAGPNIELGSGASVPYRIVFGVSGGLALITVAQEAGALTKTVPYAELGVHSNLPLGARLSLGGGVRFTAVFDPDLVIMGAAPSFTARIRGGR